MSFRRGNMNHDFVPDWPNLDLGHVPNQQFGRRLLRLLRAATIILRNPKFVRGSDVVIARNFDLLALAWLARLRWLSGGTPLIYECLDIHGLFIGARPVNRAMRFLERMLLRRTALLWVSSPGFLSGYFKPVQGYSGPVEVIENKLWFDRTVPRRPLPEDRQTPADVLTLGWVGSIRCRQTLELLAECARRMGPKLRIAIHGNVHRHTLDTFDDIVASHETITYHGPYSYPDDLERIYLGCDAVWAQDLWQRGSNSDWLLPNRIYEASWFGCPSIAVADTETGRRIAASGLGFTIATPDAGALAALLDSLDRDKLRAASASLLSIQGSEFRLTAEDVARALAPALRQDDREAMPRDLASNI